MAQTRHPLNQRLMTHSAKGFHVKIPPPPPESQNSDMKFVNKFTRPNFPAKEFYTLKTGISILFLTAINKENASLSAIWLSFGKNWSKCVNSLTFMKKIYIKVWKLAKYERNCVFFWKNLHSWQNFYTTAGRDGRDKFQVWVQWKAKTHLRRQENCKWLLVFNHDHHFIWLIWNFSGNRLWSSKYVTRLYI